MSSFQELNALTQNCATTFEFTEEDARRILVEEDDMETYLSTEDDKWKLEKLYHDETRLRMHGSTLSEYFKNKKIPRGLRIHKAPTIGKYDEHFVKRWGEILNKCSLDLMLLIIEHTTTEAQRIKTELNTLENNLKEKMGPTFPKIEKDIKDSLREYKEHLHAVKIKKYKRDTDDYARNEIYKWEFKKNPQPVGDAATALPRKPAPRQQVRNKRRPTRTRYQASHESDFTFDSDSSDPAQATGGPAFLGGNRNPARGRRRNAGGGRGHQEQHNSRMPHYRRTR